MRSWPVLILLLACTTSVGAGAPPTGVLHLTFSERSPLTSPQEIKRRYTLDPRRWEGKYVKDYVPKDYDLKTKTFEVVVPPNYRPGQNWGLLVWTGVTKFSPEWFDVLARRKLLYIAAVHWDLSIVDAVENLKKQYTLDEKRIYTAGFSDGAREAAVLLTTYPEVFRGGGLFLMGGSEFYDCYPTDVLTNENSGLDWQGPLDQIKKEMRLILTRGELDTFTPK